MPKITRKLRYALWTLNGRIGNEVSIDGPQKATVLVTYFHPSRMKHIEPQVRNLLKCNFVEKLVLSNHNPDVDVEEKLEFKDSRLVFINQDVKRGCGYRWSIANELDSDYLIVVDDDMLFFPDQLARLFQKLIDEPKIPHGVAGMVYGESDELVYREQENMTVNYLCEAYAVTKTHLQQYGELKKLVATNDVLTEMIDSSADFMVISQTGNRNPKIHNVGRLFKASTFSQAGIAVHKEDGFDESLIEVGRALNNVSLQANGQVGEVAI